MEKYEIHEKICDEIKILYKYKNEDYGDSFGKARKVVPNYTLGKLYDKFNRYMNLTINGENTARVAESLDDTLMDMANYAIMELTERRMARMTADSATQTSYREHETHSVKLSNAHSTI